LHRNLRSEGYKDSMVDGAKQARMFVACFPKGPYKPQSNFSYHLINQQMILQIPSVSSPLTQKEISVLACTAIKIKQNWGLKKFIFAVGLQSDESFAQYELNTCEESFIRDSYTSMMGDFVSDREFEKKNNYKLGMIPRGSKIGTSVHQDVFAQGYWPEREKRIPDFLALQVIEQSGIHRATMNVNSGIFDPSNPEKIQNPMQRFELKSKLGLGWAIDQRRETPTGQFITHHHSTFVPPEGICLYWKAHSSAKLPDVPEARLEELNVHGSRMILILLADCGDFQEGAYWLDSLKKREVGYSIKTPKPQSSPSGDSAQGADTSPSSE
jgi:hypothetical protein